jgi:hypothetical protein
MSLSGMRQQVNPWYLHKPLGPLVGGADDDEAVEKYKSFDANDACAVRFLIRELIVPHVARFDDAGIARIKLAMRYYLTKRDSKWDRVFNSILPPFGAPRDPRDFFVWIWEECFPGEDFHLNNLDEYEVVADCNAVNRELRLRPS